MVIGAPNLGRYQVFGNLFARSGLDTEPFRLDRHPTMSQHPITPMAEADLRKHLASQTDLDIGLYDVLRLADPHSQDCKIGSKADALLFDVLYPEQLATIGELISKMAEPGSPQFVLGSSGIEYALTAHWDRTGQLASLQTQAAAKPTFPADFTIARDHRELLAGQRSSDCCGRAIWISRRVAINTARLAAQRTLPARSRAVVDQALPRLQSGANVIVHSSRGPDDPRVRETCQAFEADGLGELEIRLRSGRILGPRLGQILGRLLEQHPMKRVGVAGGDTSGYIARELGLSALEAIAPVAPGSPLCRAFADNSLDGVEFFFKGGQVGKDDVWSTMLQGSATSGGTHPLFG